MAEQARISVVGLGRLGAPIAACFAYRGFDVVGYDPVDEKVDAMNDGEPITYEPDLVDLLKKTGGRFRATSELEDAIRSTDVTFLVVPTPTAPDGSISLVNVREVVSEVGAVLRNKDGYHMVVLTSTVMPGSTERRVRPALEEASGKKVGEGVGLCFSALFVTVGNVIRDFLSPSIALVGESDTRAGDLLQAIYEKVCENDPPIARMGFSNAELAKLAVNVFVATKISFANVLARLCEQMPGGDVDVVTCAMQRDGRIGPGALRGAISYGGPFFSKDNAALGALFRRFGVGQGLVGVLDKFNRAQVPWLADFVYERVPEGGSVGVLGLSYKPDTDVIIGSVGLELCERLVDRGLSVAAHDPVCREMARGALPPSVLFAKTPEACIEGVDVVVLATPWRPYLVLPPQVWTREGDPRVVVDCWRVVPDLADQPGVLYVPLGIGPGANGNGQRPECQRPG